MIGRLAALTLAELSLDLAVISTSSWDATHGITTTVEAKIDAIVTDEALPAEDVAAVRELGPRVLVG
jgi:DeoR/GlpR family transcriptional regulator of sugar metabolism